MTKYFSANSIIAAIIYGYIMFPILVFVIGWLNLSWAILFSVAVLFSYVQCIRQDSFHYNSLFIRENVGKLIAAFLIIAFWVYISGVGGMCYQNSDHNCRTAIYRALVEYDWPVISADGQHGLIYYFGFWLPSAVVGKLFGFRTGYLFQAVWAVIGIFIVFYLLCVWRKKVSLWLLFILIGFSGLDFIGTWLLSGVDFTFPVMQHLEWWARDFQYSSMTTQLFWVFNQAIPAWVVTMLLFVNHESKSNILCVTGCLLLTSTFSFVGLLPFVIYYLLKDIRPKDMERKRVELKNILSFQNVIGVIVIGLISFLFLYGNISAGTISNDVVSNDSISRAAILLKYLLFYIFEFGVYALLLFRREKKHALYYIVIAILLLCPLVKVGSGHDFCMRASIPALFILMLLVMDAVNEWYVEKHYSFLAMMIVVLLVGAITPFNEMHRSVYMTVTKVDAGESPLYPEVPVERLLSSENFAGKVDGNIFYEYFAR